ncbi:MAG TPA: DUF1592 domain-containing protein [Polyangia bacterium]|nr:DUF1592 domain-containing protein [Polyangia bacterium]
MSRKTTFRWSWVAALALATGCAGRGSLGTGTGGSGNGSGNGGSTGNGGSGNGAGGGGTGGGVVTEPAPAGLDLFTDSCSGGPSVGATPVRRISRIEYNNMVRDLGLDPNGTLPANQFVSEQKIDTGKAGNFNTNTYATVSGTLMNQQYIEAAEGLASAAVASSNTLNNLAGCSTQNAACAQQFITNFGTKAFRGQLDDAEKTNLTNLYTTVSGQFDFATGIQAVIEAVLTSPRFLFVIEFGQPGGGGAIPLTPMELATRLSLYLWRSIPDQTLSDAANNGHLASASDVATQATRMLADAKAKAALQDFANQWLDIENMDAVTKDTQFKKWTATVATDMHNETLTTFAQAVLGNSDYKTLLTSPSSYIDANLASFYGVSGGNPTFDSPTMVNSSANPRMGILTQGSVLAAHAHTSLPSPTKRGRLIRQQILCEEVPDPPAAVGGMPIPPPPATLTTGATTRDLYMAHFSNSTDPNKTVCNNCHQFMDWIGFGFDNYDATGAYMTTENGSNIDSSGKFVPGNSTDISGTFTGMSDMVTQLSTSQQVMQCFALEELRYALLRSETDADACSAQQIYQAFMSGGYNLQELIVAVVSSNAFMYRSPVNAGGACQ